MCQARPTPGVIQRTIRGRPARLRPRTQELQALMALDVAVVMDPIGKIKIGKDTSFAMMLEAQRRGHRH